jgi:hypothetical protein
MKLYWGDLHNHNAIGYGKGSLERSYAIARGAGLDFYAFTPHGHWPDPPDNDPKLAEYHRRGFAEKVLPEWDNVTQMADANNADGRFVCFRAFEWHSSAWGDYHVILPNAGNAPLCAARDLAELQTYARAQGALMIPHHVAYRQGWRGTDWTALDPALSPLADIHSEHGCGMEAISPHPYLLHSMGGSEKSQTAIEQLKRGRRLGVAASTDNHFGHPASYGEGLVGVWCERLERDGVFAALRARHTVAVTGDRIELGFETDDGLLGDLVKARPNREFRFDVNGWAAIETLRILKNGKTTFVLADDPPVPVLPQRRGVLRVEFGWDTMTTQETTVWSIEMVVEGGEFEGAQSGFAGGAASDEKLNRLTASDTRRIALEAFTARSNARPTSQVAARVAGTPDTRVTVSFRAVRQGVETAREFGATLGELERKDVWGSISDVFSAPKIRLGQWTPEPALMRAGSWNDPDCRPGDWYLLRVLQANGQMAWSSPIFCE